MDGGRDIIEWPHLGELQTLLKELGLPKGLIKKIRNDENLRTFVAERAKIMKSDISGWDIRRWDANIPMIHPDMLSLHMERVGRMAQYLAKILGKGDPSIANILGRIHDIPEYASPLQDVLSIRKKEASERTNKILHLIENRVAELLSRVYLPAWYTSTLGHLNAYGQKSEFGKQLAEAANHQTIESQLARLADILEGMFYPILEIRSGNNSFDSVSKNGVSIGRLQELKNGMLFPELFSIVQIDFDEILNFIDSPHIPNPPKLYLEWLNIWRDVQRDFAYDVWNGKINEYSKSILGLLHGQNNEQDTIRSNDAKKNNKDAHIHELYLLGCSQEDIKVITNSRKHRIVEITHHTITGNINVRVDIGKKKYQTFHLSPYMENGIRKVKITTVPRGETFLYIPVKEREEEL